MILDAQYTQTLLFPNLADLFDLIGVCALVVCFLELRHDRLKGDLCVADAAGRIQLLCVELGGVDRQHLDVRVAEQHPLGAGDKVVETGADADHEVAVLAQLVGCQAAGDADAADRELKRIRQRGVAGLGLGYRDVERLAELHHGLAGLGVTHAAAGDEHRLLGSLDQLDRLIDLIVVRNAARNVVDTLLEEVVRIFKALALYVLRHGDDRGAAVCGVGQHAHRVDQRAHQLLRTRNAVPVLGNRLEAVGSGHGQVVRNLELLEYRVRLAGCKGVGREQQERDVIDGSGQGGGHHVRRAYADRGRAGDDLAAVVLLCIGNRSVRHALLVAALVYAEMARVFLQRLAEADDHAVAEDGEDTVYERLNFAIHFDVLLVQELDDRLADCHFGFAHVSSSSNELSLSAARLRPSFFDGYSLSFCNFDFF